MDLVVKIGQGIETVFLGKCYLYNMYYEFPPNENLSRLVWTYACIDINNTQGVFFAPDITHTSIIVTIKSNVEIVQGAKKIIPPVFSVKGAFDAPFYFSYLENQITSFIVDFTPIGMYEFTRQSGTMFTNKFVNALDLWEANEVKTLLKNLSKDISFEDRVKFLDDFLEIKAPDILSEKSLLVEQANFIAKQNHYQWTVKMVAVELGVSERSLRRAFNEVLGLSPKQYFIRKLFEEVIKQYSDNKEEKTYIADFLESSFHDFSHINKWFKKFALTSPTKFANYDMHFIEKVLERSGS